MPSDIVRFGVDFELDRRAYELRRAGRSVKLERIPMELLFLLVERQGELVTREQILDRIWGNDVFLDTDNSINAAIRKIREVLKDDPERPTFVQTVTGKGYRFVATVTKQTEAREKSPEAPSLKSGSVGPGLIVSHYQVWEKIASGGMGDVFRAEDLRLKRHVAIKFLSEKFTNDNVALERFLREARAASSLNHPNICTIYEVEEFDGRPVMVMELLEGETLKQRIRRAPVPINELLDVGSHVADALEAAHTNGIVHRDIKPGNIFITKKGHVKVLDFGLAKLTAGHVVPTEDVENPLTRPGVLAGTTYYMSPEQLRGGDLDGRSDIFSLGIVLYEMASGAKPFTGKNLVAISDAILNTHPPAPTEVNPALPAGLDSIIQRAMEKDRKRRYQQASELRADLQEMKRDTDLARPPIAVKSTAPTKAGSRGTIAAVVAAAALLLGVAGYLAIRRTTKLTDKDTVVLADFANATGDAVFEGTLRQGMAVQLEQSPFLSIVPEGRVQETLRLMGRPADAPLTPEVAREVCERTSSAAVLNGSIASLGTQYVLGLRAKNCRTGDVLAEEQAQAAKKEDVLKVLSQIASKFRAHLGESLTTVERHDTPLETATTSSLDALKAYSTAMQVSFSSGFADALPLLKRAVDIDPQFATAYAFMGLTYSNLGETALAIENTSKAYQLRDHASDRERFFITTLYDRQVTGNLEREQQTLRLWGRTYPRDRNAHGLFSGFATHGSGQYEKAIAEAKIALTIDPDFAYGYVNIASANFFLDRLAETERAIQNAIEHKRQTPDLVLLEYHLACVKGDTAGMDRATASARGKPGLEDWMLHAQALVEARSGRLRTAEALSRRAQDLARKAGQKESAASYQTAEALWSALYGNASEAKRSATAALELSDGRDVEYAAAFALALAGDWIRSQTLARDLEKRFPEDTSVQSNYLPALQALFALNRRDPQNAIEQLQPAVSYELAVPAIDYNEFFGGLYPVYVRGEAYLVARRPTEAAAQFQKILDHPGIVAGDPIGAMARLEMGRAYVLLENKAKAKAAYEDFLNLWSGADPDIPILKQAKLEYARLQLPAPSKHPHFTTRR